MVSILRKTLQPIKFNLNQATMVKELHGVALTELAGGPGIVDAKMEEERDGVRSGADILERL